MLIGLLLERWALVFLTQLVPPEMFLFAQPTVDGRTLIVTSLVALATSNLRQCRPTTGPDHAVWTHARSRARARHRLQPAPFGERFVSEFGIAPKATARVFRFERACRLFLRSPRLIADVAMASGFHDQAHMVREWHALAG
jgi:hypothetical protein